ncbi:RidA family protein [Pantoea sp. Al-1710]|uniref:RidA family protein n=1 Tax=Candidatus Pantoea communis TaxID=2608354 RepID=A0ABX0RUJ4_9GAMM|nr:Rid family hydrolase [Pantoea communis]NIG21263.1 RidA family protein [Pantoea communis]
MSNANKKPEAVWPDGTPKPLMPYTPAIKAGGWLFVSGHLASDYQTALAPEAISPNPNLGNDMALQSRYLLGNIAKTAAGRDINKDAVRIWQWYVSAFPTLEEFKLGNTWPRITITPYLDERNKFIQDPRPASTGMGIHELLVKDTLIEVDLILADDDGENIGYPVPAGVPAPLAGYSPAIRRGDWVFLAGEIPVDWQGDYGSGINLGEPSALAKEARVNPYVWYGSEIEQQTEYTLWKLQQIAESAGTSLSRAVKADVYIGDPADFEGMEKVWKRWFPEHPPARCVIPYMGLGGKGSRVEIALTLLANDSELIIETIETDNAPKPFSHEPQAVKAGNFLFLSQQLPCDSDGVLPAALSRNPDFPYYGMPARDQMRYMMKNIAAICEAGGTSLENVVRRACFHDDGKHFAETVEEWAAHFPGLKPCSTTMILGGPLVVPGAHTLLDVIAWVP